MKPVLIIVACILWFNSCFSQELLRPMPKNWRYAPAGIGTFIPNTSSAVKNVAPIPQDLYTCNLGFFCRQELKMQQAHVPVTFRIGSMDDCNYLEQKPGYKISDK